MRFTSDYIKQVNAIDRAFNTESQCKYDPFSNTYNPKWRDNPNLRYENCLNKAIMADSSMDFSPNKIIKRDNPLYSQIPMLWGHRVMMKTLPSNIVTLQQNAMPF